MSLQVCYCGWSKMTTYQGLRTHQGKMGCTPKGMRIPEAEQIIYLPKYTYTAPQIKLQEPFRDIFSNLKSDASDSLSKMGLQVCHCGWSEITSYHGLRTHQGKMGCTPKGMTIPQSEQPFWAKQLEESQLRIVGPLRSAPVKQEDLFSTSNFITQTNPAATQSAVMEIITPLVGPQQHFLQMGANPFNTHQALDFTAGPKPSLMQLPSLTFTTQTDPAAADTTVRESNESLFETPPRSPPTTFSPGKVRRALDFSTATQQVEHHLKPPITTAQEIVKHPNGTEKEDEREAQKRRKARQDRTKADLQQKIHTGETKVAEVRSSVKACKGNLDAEWLEINNVFSEVMREVEEARQKALQPLEERRRKVKREAKDLVQKLQREIDALKKTIDELDKNTDLQVSPPTGLHESQDWSDVSVDTSLYFGSLRSATSTMMKQIHQKLEKLSSVELKRIPTFAVDVKLDPASAHRCLVLSDDGKEVRDGGKKSEVPDPPERFDLFGSVVALNSVTSGRSYWEVEVRNKSGWDLGVARRDAKRKGKLSLNPDEGYWVTVHYEGGKYAALAAPPVSLSLEEKPEKVGVFVDYEEGLVSFYDVTTRSHIYSFTECSFGDEVFPYFSPHLKENDKNAAALIISAVPKQ